MITDVDDFFSKGCGRCQRFATPDCSALTWSSGLKELRRICLAAGLTETVKWGHPCYMREDRNIAILGAVRQDFRLTFFNGALMTDPAAILKKQGANAQHADTILFTAPGQVSERADIVRDYLQEAIGYADRGVKPLRAPRMIELPDELVDALESDAELSEAFHDLTPGRQRSYVLNLTSAKQSATRIARIAKFRDKILAGKGATER